MKLIPLNMLSKHGTIVVLENKKEESLASSWYKAKKCHVEHFNSQSLSIRYALKVWPSQKEK